ncbi:hypothetical protein IV203_017040 [Nitzschia inconspicua]|uniref:Uncharacterized protein n=1 Tax=Nitzschia inconspicua TaxID=303405 RepID=A0A9K3KR55_9STRA|nr:hypothetical protein IV203_017040 [Nitzschia inconspicua]
MTRRTGIPKFLLVVATTTFVCLFHLLDERGRVRLLLFSASVTDVSLRAPSQNDTSVVLAGSSINNETTQSSNYDESLTTDHGINSRDDTHAFVGNGQESEFYSENGNVSYGVLTTKKWDQYLEEKVEKRKSRERRHPPISLESPGWKQSDQLVLSHVWSPYVVWRKQDVPDDPYFPLDQAQNVTWGSMWRAKQFYETQNPDRNLTIYCAVLWMDVEVLQKHQPPLCQEENTIVLDRSTHTEYPDLQPPIHYPFINDILLKAGDEMDRYSTRRKNKSSARNKYMIYTNADIAVVKKFYTTLEKAIVAQPTLHEAFQINRRTVASEYRDSSDKMPRPLTSNDLELIEKEILRNYTFHPGVDCFVMRKDLMDGIDLGNLFLGQPPWAGVLKTILQKFMSLGYGEYSSKAGLTYHMGDDREWSLGGQNLTGTGKLGPIQPCVFPNKPRSGLWSDHRYQNTMNCAIISKGYKKFLKDDGPFPPFLKPNAYYRATEVFHVRERERKIDAIKQEAADRKKRHKMNVRQ